MQYSNLTVALQNVNGASFIGVDALTAVTLTGGKKNPHQGRVTKRTRGASVMVFQNKNVNGYEAMVQRRLAAEGRDPESFELGERAWGHRIANTPFVQHEKAGVTKYYLEVIFLHPGASEFLLDGNPISKADIEGFPTKVEGEQGGLDNKVIVRSFAAESITQIRVDGQTFN